MLLTAEGAVLLLIDLQERLMPVIARSRGCRGQGRAARGGGDAARRAGPRDRAEPRAALGPDGAAAGRLPAGGHGQDDVLGGG